MIVLKILLISAGGYGVLSLILTHLAHQKPRQPIVDPPDWGRVTDTFLAAVDGGYLEVWRIEPETDSKGTVVMAHGWGRNRDRMIERARFFGGWGYTVIVHSARDHGKSSRKLWMNAFRFAEDIETVMAWAGEPVILYGHSAGSAGAIIAAARNPERIRALILEGCYARTKLALRGLYRWFNPAFGFLFGPAIVFWMDLFYRGKMDTVSPVKLAAAIDAPVMLVHGGSDRRFPVAYAKELQKAFRQGQAELFIAEGANHSGSCHAAQYPGVLSAFLKKINKDRVSHSFQSRRSF